MHPTVRQRVDAASRPLWLSAFRVMPIPALAYVAGLRYSNDRTKGSPFVKRVVTAMIGMNFVDAGPIMNERLVRMPVSKRRQAARAVWLSPTASAWSDSHFDHPEVRSRQYVYHATQQIAVRLGRPIRVLELGCVNGGSLSCLRYLGIDVARFEGVDISGYAIDDGRSRFANDPTVVLHEGDFLDVVDRIESRFDVLLVNLTFLFLDQSYLEELVAALAGKTDRVVISEKELPGQEGRPSQIGDWGNSPIDYSHDYERLFAHVGFTIESGGLVPIDERFGAGDIAGRLSGKAFVFQAVLVSPRIGSAVSPLLV